MLAGGLLPGMLVQARVRACTMGGMLVSFLMFFQGAVDHFHLYQVPAGPHCPASVVLGQGKRVVLVLLKA